MKKSISIVLILALILLSFTGCAQTQRFETFDENGNPKTIIAHPYGVFNSDEKCQEVYYSPSIGNVILACILIETVVVPVVIFGWYTMEPQYLKNVNVNKK